MRVEARVEIVTAEPRSRAFFHGHTLTAHPIGCAVALASLRVIAEEDTPARLNALGARIEFALADLRGDDRVLDLRRTGGIVALELRPLGNVLYAMPPACTSDAQTNVIAGVLRELVALD